MRSLKWLISAPKLLGWPEVQESFGTAAWPGPKGVAMTEWYFVWVEGLRGPMPQKWSSDGLWGQIGRQDVIVRFALSDAEAHLPIDELAKRHPIPDRK